MSTTVSTSSRVPNNLRFRRSFGRIKKIIDIPNLIDIQKRSYDEFLQRAVAPDQRRDQGLQAVFKSVFPIKDFNETPSLEFVSYTLSDSKYDFDPRDILYVRIDRRRKFHATVLLRALGLSTEDLLNHYYRKDTIVLEGRKAAKLFKPEHLVGVKASRDIRNPSSNDLIVKEGRKFTKLVLRQMEQAALAQIPIPVEAVPGRIAPHRMTDPTAGESALACN